MRTKEKATTAKTEARDKKAAKAGGSGFNTKDLLECLTSVDGMMAGSKTSADDQSDAVVFADGYVMAGSPAVGLFCRRQFDTRDLRGAVALDPLLDLVRRISDKSVDLVIKDGVVAVTAGKLQAGIRHEMEVRNQYPDLPKKWMKLPVDFTSALAAASLSVAKEDLERPMLSNVHIKDRIVESTNNKKLTRFELLSSLDDEFLIPSGVVGKLVAMIPSDFGVSGNVVHFRAGGSEIAVTRASGDFPDLSKFCENIKGDVVEFPVETALVLARIMAITKDAQQDTRMVEISFSKDSVEFKAKGVRGWVREIVDASYKGKPVVVRINPEFLGQVCGMALTATVSGKIVMFQTDKMRHVIVQMQTQEK